jgi:hypothetical protein
LAGITRLPSDIAEQLELAMLECRLKIAGGIAVLCGVEVVANAGELRDVREEKRKL